MRRRISLLLVGTFVVVPAVGSANFSDVQQTPYQTAFVALANDGVIQGYPDGTARPYALLNRAEAVTVLMNARDLTRQRVEQLRQLAPPIGLFADVRQSDWFRPYVEAAFERAVVRGYPDHTFRAGRRLSVEEAVTMLMRSFGAESQGVAQSSSLPNRPGQWYTPYISAAIERNIVPSNARLQVGTAITRAEFFEMVYRMRTVSQTGQPYQEPAPALVAANPPEPSAPVAQPVQNSQPVEPGPPIANLQFPSRQNTQNTGQVHRPNNGQSSYTTSPNVGTGNIYRPISQTVQSSQQPADQGPPARERTFTISIPKVGIENLLVTHPTDPFTSDGMLAPLQNGVGHLFSYPGGNGKIMVYGHSSGYPWDVSQYTKIFRRINELDPGDRIIIDYAGERYEYEVTFEETVPADDTSRFDDDGSGEELILYTCWPPDSISQRYLVHAKPV